MVPIRVIGLALWALASSEAFLWSASICRPAVASRSTTLLAEPRKPTSEQQEQLDKYGSTPETSMEILFDQLMGDDASSDEFLEKTGADEEAREKWQSFISSMKQIKAHHPEIDDE